MKPELEDYLLKLPTGTLRKGSYAWFGVVVFYPWSLLIAAGLCGLLLLSLLLVNLQNRAWEHRELREAEGATQPPYIDRPRLAHSLQIRNFLLALLASSVVAYLLGGRMNLSRLQWFLIFIGFFILQMDLRLFGAPVVYILSHQGLAIRYSDLKVFIRFGEIRSIAQVKNIKKPSPRWRLLTPSQSTKEGLLLIPQDKQGFTRLLDQILLAPTNNQEFLGRIPSRIKFEEISLNE